MREPSQLDEGYSEDTRSQPDSDMVYDEAVEHVSVTPRVQDVLQLVLSMPAEARKGMSHINAIPHMHDH